MAINNLTVILLILLSSIQILYAVIFNCHFCIIILFLLIGKIAFNVHVYMPCSEKSIT